MNIENYRILRRDVLLGENGFEVCEKCGCEKSPLGNHYVGGHLQCACGKNIDECCQGETANELND